MEIEKGEEFHKPQQEEKIETLVSEEISETSLLTEEIEKGEGEIKSISTEEEEEEININNVSLKPNPFIIGKGKLCLNFLSTGRGRIEMHFLKDGKALFVLPVDVKKGENEIEWSGEIEEGRYILPGIYILSINQNQKSLIKRRLIIRR